jgi:hypothetical protein
MESGVSGLAFCDLGDITAPFYPAVSPGGGRLGVERARTLMAFTAALTGRIYRRAIGTLVYYAMAIHQLKDIRNWTAGWQHARTFRHCRFQCLLVEEPRATSMVCGM